MNLLTFSGIVALLVACNLAWLDVNYQTHVHGRAAYAAESSALAKAEAERDALLLKKPIDTEYLEQLIGKRGIIANATVWGEIRVENGVSPAILLNATLIAEPPVKELPFLRVYPTFIWIGSNKYDPTEPAVKDPGIGDRLAHRRSFAPPVSP